MQEARLDSHVALREVGGNEISVTLDFSRNLALLEDVLVPGKAGELQLPLTAFLAAVGVTANPPGSA